MANINKIKLSGTTYSIQDENATKTVELTQAQYDALAVKDPNTFYIITDATAGDLSNYYTKSETSGATEISTALALKADTATTYTKTEVDTALASKQDTLVSGTNIKTINNESILGEGNITIEGGGGGSTYSAGTNISIDSANTINCTLPITATTDTTNKAIIIGQSITATNTNNGCVIIGSAAKGSLYDVIIGNQAKNNSGGWNDVVAIGHEAKGYSESIAIGSYAETCNRYRGGGVAIGYFAMAKNMEKAVAIGHEVSTTGTTKTNINNQIKIDSSNQVYIYNKDNTEMICLQDQLGGGGGGSSYTAGEGIDITNDVISVTGKVDTSTYNTYTAATDTALASKQTTLTAGTGISIVDNVISATGGTSITIDPSLDSGSTNPVANSAITNAIANATNGTLKEDLVFSATCGYGTIEANVGGIDDEFLRINIYPAKTLQFVQYRSFGRNYYYKCFVLDIETKTEYNAYWNVTYNGITSSGGTGINYVTLNLPSGRLKFTVTDGTKYRIIGFERDIHSSNSSRESYSTESTYEVNIPSGTTTNELFQYIENVDRTKNVIGLTFGSSYGLGTQYFTDTKGGKIYYQQSIFPLNTSFTAHTANTTIHVTSAQTTAWDAKVDTSAITTSITSASTDSQVPSAKAVYDVLGNIETLLSQI